LHEEERDQSSAAVLLLGLLSVQGTLELTTTHDHQQSVFLEEKVQEADKKISVTVEFVYCVLIENFPLLYII
jgi:hypothetical protein